MSRGAAYDVKGTLIRSDPVLAIPKAPTEKDLDLVTLVRELAPMAGIPFKEIIEDIGEVRYYPISLSIKTLFYNKEEDIRRYFDKHITAAYSDS